MAKKRKDRPERDTVTTYPVPSVAARAVYLPALPKSSLTDLRYYQPTRPKVAFDDVGRRAKILQAPVRQKPARSPSSRSRTTLPDYLSGAFRERLAFALPKRVLVCVRRKQRREVLFAKKRTGRGSRSRKRFNVYSQVRC